MPALNSPTECLECGAPLSPADAGGVCPKCLLRLGLASQLASGTLGATAPGIAPGGDFTQPFDFGGYRIVRLLGKGGMGAVYEAEQLSTGRRVALKVLGHTLNTPEMRQRFLREGQLAAAVRHPNSVAVFSTEEIEGAPVIAMELVPDGTLKDRVKSNGPLPVPEAVDAVLQIIDGLDAAHAGGVLHRDIKPANCFFGADGIVKVGDFGLSISTLVKAEQQLTQTGAVLGTPAFASPEQLRAQEIDVRSDIYSVGATLYYLLTGQPTHDASTLVGLIAAVLERDPIDPQTLRPEIPSALSRVVMRCLSRNAAARFPNYAELRTALLPFRSAAPRPAPLSLRLLAGTIDALVLSVPWVMMISATGFDPEADLILNRTTGAFLAFLVIWLWEIIALALPEGRWGAGLGKALCGLRVIALNGDVPGFKRTLGRWAVFAIAGYIQLPLLLMGRTSGEYREGWLNSEIFWEELLPIPLSLALFVTMRRRNGFAAVHDLLTGTRVVVAPPAAEAVTVHVPTPPSAHPSGAKIGPFVAGERLAAHLTLGFDDGLRRHVWIHHLSAGTPPVPPARRDLGRPARARWLNGTRAAEESWDAYEAPEGQPLVKLFDAARSWAQVRRWLFELADELRAGLDDGTLPAAIGVDRLWLTRDGRVLLLDYPAPGAPAFPVAPIRDQRSAQEFLSSIARAALVRRVPLHAREFLHSLSDGRFESMAQVAGNLRADLEKPATVSFRRRLISVAVPVVIALLFAFGVARSVSLDTRRFEEQWAQAYPGRVSPREIVEVSDYSLWDDLAKGDPAGSVDVRVHCLALLAGRYRDVAEAEEFWSRPAVAGASAARIRERIRTASKVKPTVSEDEIRKAEKALQPHVKDHRQFSEYAHFLVPLGLLNFVLAVGAFVGIVGAALFGTPPLLRMNDLAVIKEDGRPAPRWRVTLRSLLAWSPIMIAGVAAIIAQYARASEFRVALFVTLTALLIAVLGAVWCVLRPERGPHDHLTGTWLAVR